MDCGPSARGCTDCGRIFNHESAGDPMVLAANIIWINSDATSIRSPSKNQNGELALDIILEKKAVRKNGDAWRVVMDSCLPVLHLIDIKRSIPYAVKQVQELLGISCAFEQAVQVSSYISCHPLSLSLVPSRLRDVHTHMELFCLFDCLFEELLLCLYLFLCLFGFGGGEAFQKGEFVKKEIIYFF